MRGWLAYCWIVLCVVWFTLMFSCLVIVVFNLFIGLQVGWHTRVVGDVSIVILWFGFPALCLFFIWCLICSVLCL